MKQGGWDSGGELDARVRTAAFAFLNEQASLHGETLPRPLLAEGFLMGGVCGAALTAGAGSMLLGAIVGIAGAVAGTLGGHAVRARMAAAFGRDRPAALVEDAIAIGAAFVVVLAS